MILNPNQKKAVTHQKGPLLIVAGAGTGKTTVITERIKHLIQNKKVDPQHIFATSFTQKSAEEMLNRLDQVMPLGYREPWLGTFHSLCERLLRFEGLEIGLDPTFKIMSATDQWIFIKQHLFDFELKYYRPLGNPNKFITALITFFSRLSDENTSQDELDNYVAKLKKISKTEEEQIAYQRWLELQSAYKKYQQLKVENSVMDFGDLITQTIILLQTRPNLLKKYQSQFEHILVDEFQDTNFAQYELIKLLAPPKSNANLIVVGDDNQAIFKFRGASISNILQFKKDYKNAKSIVLNTNYRSTQTILDSSYKSIQHNNPDTLESILGISKKLKSTIKKTGEFEIIKFEHLENEVDWTVQQIIKLVTKHNLNYQNIAILCRANSQLEPYALQLKMAGLPYQLISNRGLFDTNEVKDLITLLKVLSDPADTINLLQLSQSHVFNLADNVMFQAIRKAKKKSTSAWQEIQEIHTPQMANFIKTITDYQSIGAETPVTQLLHQFIEDSGYLKPFISEDTVENQLKIKNLNLFFNHLKRFEVNSDDKSLVSFLSVLDLWLESGENPGQAQIEDIDTISLMTIHAAKGLEFDAVFIGSLVAGRFPTYNRKDRIVVPDELVKETLPVGDEHIGEERRLFYVGLTRAKRFLYLTYPEDVGGVRKRKPSGFLEETGIKTKTISPSTSPLPFSFTTEAPKAYLLKDGQFVINQVSYSQIDTFKACPLKYKYRYLLQIPAKPHHSLSFGRTMHETLHQFHQHQMQGNKMTLNQLLKLYDTNFIDDGYEGPDHKQKRYEDGKEALKSYYSHYKKVLGKPKLLEQKFSLMIGDTKLTGKIDRIDTVKDGQLEIVDYKTGSIKDQKKVDNDEQLTLYALAAKESLGLEIDTASLYFLEDGGHKVTTTRTKKQLTNAHNKLDKDIQQIKSSKFPAKPDPVKCGFCEYNSLCPFASKQKT